MNEVLMSTDKLMERVEEYNFSDICKFLIGLKYQMFLNYVSSKDLYEALDKYINNIDETNNKRLTKGVMKLAFHINSLEFNEDNYPIEDKEGYKLNFNEFLSEVDRVCNN